MAPPSVGTPLPGTPLPLLTCQPGYRVHTVSHRNSCLKVTGYLNVGSYSNSNQGGTLYLGYQTWPRGLTVTGLYRGPRSLEACTALCGPEYG